MDWSLLKAMVAGSFVELWSPAVLLVVIALGYLYVKVAGRDEELKVTGMRKASFLLGLALFYVTTGSPLNHVGHHYLFSVHMLNQSLLYLVMPIFILYGMPGQMLLKLLRALHLERIVKVAVQPLIALFTFNLLFSLYHVPMVMNRVMENGWQQLIYEVLLLISAFQMWFPIVSRIDGWPELTELKRMAYIFVNGILLTPACALIIFAGKPLYEMYQGVSMPFAQYTVTEDQQLGGVIMKIIQEITYATALAATFFRWFRTERKKEEESEDGYSSIAYDMYAADRR